MKQDRLVTFGRLGWRRGFTLIELLIVVAIIAILAAIAVPNFMEAQVRGKIARARADMRTLRTALEAYAVEWGKYPPDMGKNAAWSMLTTPVAYMSSILRTPFEYKNNLDNDAYWNVYRYDNELIGNPLDGSVYLWPSELTEIGIRYVVSCVGPDELSNLEILRSVWSATLCAIDSGTGGFDVLYDPTNGSRSRGDLIVSNKRPYN